MPATRRDRGPFDLRELLRLLAVVGGWIGFVWLWLLVGRQPWDASRLVWLIVGSLVIVPLLTLAWVLHNRAIFKRKGERRGVAAADFGYATDWHGRTVDAGWAQLQHSRFVTVSVDGTSKTFSAADRELADSVAAQAETAAKGGGASAAPSLRR